MSPFYPKCSQFPILYPFADRIVFDVDVFRSFMVFWATGNSEGSFVVDSNIDVWDIKPIFQKSLVLPNVAEASVQHRTYPGQLSLFHSIPVVSMVKCVQQADLRHMYRLFTLIASGQWHYI